MSAYPITRCDFVYLFDVKDGNPNGDPDAANLPRVDPENGCGLVTDVCLKRKVRNYIQYLHENNSVPQNDSGYRIFIQLASALNAAIAEAHEATGGMPDVKDKKWKTNKEKAAGATEWMCRNFYDVRAFGAVMSTGANAGQVRGPIQLTMARSVDPIMPLEFAITRCATADDKISAKKGVTSSTYREWEAAADEDTLRTMGRKFTVPYGLYRMHGFINPHLAAKTGFGEEDLALFWKALEQMFETDRSAARGEMAPQALICFEHADALGNAPASKLFSRVKIERKSLDEPARSFDDYELTIDETDLPEGITIHRRI